MDSVENGKLSNLKKSFKSLKWYEWIMAIVMIVIAGKVMVDAFVNPGTAPLPAWLTVINFISAICGVVCIFFCAKASISNYIFGLINTIVYAIYLWYVHIYGTLCLELLVYLPCNIFGWVVWAKHRDNVDTEKTKAKKLTVYECLLSVVGVGIITAISYYLLSRTNGQVKLLDSFTVAIGIVATVLQFARFREQYVWWLIQDVIAVWMYIVAFDPVYLTKKSIYLIMAFIGLYNWVKLQKTRNVENE